MNACRKNDNPMPGNLSDLRPFERILATGSLSAAAREAGLLPPIATSRNQSPDLGWAWNSRNAPGGRKSPGGRLHALHPAGQRGRAARRPPGRSATRNTSN